MGKDRYVHYTRMAAFPLALGLVGVLVTGTLNRVMIVELAIPASLVGLFLATPPLLSPLRVWLGYRSDAFPLRGLRREPYIVLGSVLAALGVIAATILALTTATLGGLAVAGLLLAFLAYGAGKHLSSNTFEALIADKFEGAGRRQAVTLFKIPMFVGIIGGAIVLGRALDPFTGGRLAAVVLAVGVLAVLLATLAVWRQEPRTEIMRAASRRAQQTPFWRILRDIIWRDPQARRFFSFVMLAVIGTQAQDMLLEPYGALVLGMSVSQTTRLTSVWGAGAILAMALSGGWLVRRFGYRPVLRLGLLTNIAVFGGIIIAGALGSVGLFQGLVLILGVGTGLAFSGALAAVIDFTTAIRAGFLMGVWGVAGELGEAVGNLFGGAMVDTIRALTGGDALAAYGAVFVTEGVLLAAALALLSRINVQESAALSEALMAERALTAETRLPEPTGR